MMTQIAFYQTGNMQVYAGIRSNQLDWTNPLPTIKPSMCNACILPQ